jgi:hypothetical protein
MRTLRAILLAAIASLAFAAPASANSIHLSVSPPTSTPAAYTPAQYEVVAEGQPGNVVGAVIKPQKEGTSENVCSVQAGSQHTLLEKELTSTAPFSLTAEIPTNDYPLKGVYKVCYALVNTPEAWNETTFTVTQTYGEWDKPIKEAEEAAAKQKQEEELAARRKHEQEAEAAKAKETAEREATGKVAQEAKERVEREAKERVEREAKERVEREVKEDVSRALASHAKLVKELKVCQRKYKHNKKKRMSCERLVRRGKKAR